MSRCLSLYFIVPQLVNSIQFQYMICSSIWWYLCEAINSTPVFFLFLHKVVAGTTIIHSICLFGNKIAPKIQPYSIKPMRSFKRPSPVKELEICITSSLSSLCITRVLHGRTLALYFWCDNLEMMNFEIDKLVQKNKP